MYKVETEKRMWRKHLSGLRNSYTLSKLQVESLALSYKRVVSAPGKNKMMLNAAICNSETWEITD